MPEKKTSIVRRLVAAGEHKKALAIAKGFRLGTTKEDRDSMSRAYECMAHRGFYEQIGKDPKAEIEGGVRVLRRLCGAGAE